MINLFRNRFFLYFLAFVNIAVGIFSAVFYYSYQLVPANPVFWVIIADCPVAALLFALNVFLIARGKGLAWLCFLSIVANFKFALWTIFVLVSAGQGLEFWYVILAHLLLLAETIVLLGLFEYKVRHVILAVVLFAIGDYFDYALNFHPFVPQGGLFLAVVFALASTIVFPILLSIIFSGDELHLVKEKLIVSKKKKWAN